MVFRCGEAWTEFGNGGRPSDALAKKRTRAPIVRRCGRDYPTTTDPECH